MSATTRRGLWELDVDCHASIVGCSWTAAELRRLTDRLFRGRSHLGDFELHAAVAEQCASRNKVSAALQRDLHRRFAGPLRRCDGAADRGALAALWAQALADGEAAAAVWATLSHGHCDEALRVRVLQDLYLLHNERVVQQPAEAAIDAALRAQIAALNADALRAQQRQASWRSELLAERDVLRAELAVLRGRVAAQEALIARLREAQMPQPQLQAERPAPPAPAPIRVAAAPQACAPQSQSQSQPQPQPQPQPQSKPMLAADALRSTSVLCVGGRNGQVPQYRELVERHGGRFAHHDGGIEDSAHRLDAELAAADAVLCQSGCLSHNAYARVKAHCKRSGKPCVYLDKPGIGSFLRGLVQLRRAAYG